MSETPDAEQLLELGAVLGDKGYDSDDLLKFVASLKAEAVIPAKRSRKVQRPLNRELYKDRNKVERFFGRVKHYRRISTRYEKTARNYMAMLHLESGMLIFPRERGTFPERSGDPRTLGREEGTLVRTFGPGF